VSTFSDARTQLAADLSALGVTVHPSWPTALDPPCAFITPPISDQYLRAGQTFGEYILSLDLVLLVEHADAADALATLEGLIETAVIHTADWMLSGVDAPAPTAVAENGAEYLAAAIHLSKPVRL
jgi:hypothetical protein